MAAPVVAGTVALMLHANPSLTPNMVKAILQFSAQVYTQYDYLTQGAGFLNARGAVQLAEYFKEGRPGSSYPRMKGWSRHIFWGNRRISGGVLTPNGTAWANNIVWGDSGTPGGQNIVWGENCDTTSCDNIVWGNNIVWGDDGDDNIVWGNTDGDNIVWGNDCAGANCDNIVWGQSGEDNIVWGNAEGIENIVWGQSVDAIVWGSTADENLSWGNSAEDVLFGDDVAELESFDPTLWDDLFEIAVPTEITSPWTEVTFTAPADTTMSTTTSTGFVLPGGVI
jgi:hypothetical protein